MVYPEPPAILSGRDLRPADLDADLPGALLRTYAWMSSARTADNRILELFRQGLIRGTVTGGQGNEGLIVPLALLADKAVDVISFTHRGLGGHLIWSGHLVDHLNQYFANAASPTKAREGNVHHGDPRNRSLPMISHLGIMVSNVVGATDSQRRLGRPAMGFAFIGDGSSSTGDMHESLNLASLLSLPVLFVIENNRYAYSTPVSEQYAAGHRTLAPRRRLRHRGPRPRLHRGRRRHAPDVRRRHRPGPPDRPADADRGEHAAPARPRRLRHLRLPEAAARPTPCLRPIRCRNCAPGSPPTASGAKLDASTRRSPHSSRNASRSRWPSRAPTRRAWRPTCSRRSRRRCRGCPRSTPNPESANPKPKTEILTMAQALNRALRKILAERPESLVLGQDIATYGGAFKVTEDLFKDFGRPRVMNLPARRERLHGLRHRPRPQRPPADRGVPVRRLLHRGHDADHAQRRDACISARAPGVPLVLRLPCGGGLTFGSFHSEELESFFLVDARPQGALSQQPAGRLQRAARRLRGRQPRPAVRAQGPLPPRQAAGHLGPALPRHLESQARPARRFCDLRHLRRDGAPGRRGVRLLRRRIRARLRPLGPARPLPAPAGRHQGARSRAPTG